MPTGLLPSIRWDSHSALAKEIRCRFACTASIMADSSSDLLIEGLRPRPGFVTKPLIPSVLYRSSQLLTARAAPAYMAHPYYLANIF